MRANDFRWNSSCVLKFVAAWQKREQSSRGVECSLIPYQKPLWNQTKTQKQTEGSDNLPKIPLMTFLCPPKESVLHTQNTTPALLKEIWVLVEALEPLDAALLCA